MSKIIAYQLSLLGDTPKPMHEWRRTFHQWTFCGARLPFTDDALRQALLLTQETRTFPAELYDTVRKDA